MDGTMNGGEGTSGNAQQPKRSKVVWIIIVVVVLAALVLLGKMFSPERLTERVFEKATDGAYNIDIDRDGSVEFTGGDGEQVRVSAGENVRLPDAWPSDVTIPAGAVVTYAGSVQGGGGSTVHTASFTSTQTPAAVMEYYRSLFERNGWTIEASIAASDGSMLSATREDGEGAIVYISSDGSGTSATLSVEKK